MKKHVIIITGQVMFLVLALCLLYYLYPKATIDVQGDWATFNSINANVIMISENPDFSNPRYIDLSDRKNLTFNLEPGTYYWKPDNGVIRGWKNEFTIDSVVGLSINKSDNESNLTNIGNVKINITKTKDGLMVGRIVLEPDESQGIENTNETYIARQAG
ncbi:Uncharacterised protein [uncultured archaeon]|nr:Uncharacterised protein [uncultured archaeon]